MDLRDIYPGLNGAFSYIVVILSVVALARMFPRISKTWDRKVHRTRKNVLWKIDEKVEEVEHVNIDDLWKHIFELRKPREKGNHKKASSLGHFPWPNVPQLQDLEGIVSLGSDLDIHGAVRAIVGRVNVATVAALVVAHTLERVDNSVIGEELVLTTVMWGLASALKRYSESPEGMQYVMQEATSLIVEGARVVSLQVGLQVGRRRSQSEVRAIRHKLYKMHTDLSVEFNYGVSTAGQHQWKSRLRTQIRHQRTPHLSKEDAIHADNGQVEEDLLLTWQVEEVYIHNNEQVEEDLLVPEPQKVYINAGQVEEEVEEDLLVPEPQKAYIHNNEQVEEDLVSTGRQKVFKMEALVAATNNFHEDNKVGEGGFGAVYKGTTHHGEQIAVKKMSLTSNEGRKQFMNEKLLAEVQHRNLVNLLGSCEQESQGFLVYEYFPNGSLHKFLLDADKRKELDWKKQYNIILGLARGLLYLHQDSQQRIVHRDIKTSNILLDEQLNPKIADFGTAKLFPEDRTHVTATSGAVGTFGYIAPEYFMTGKLSLRIDVYSFGIVVLELLTGEKISLESLERVWHSYKKKKFVTTIDPTMTRTEKAKALRCIQVGLLCIQEDLLRPTMSQVITMLSTSENLPVPKKPPLVSSTERSCF